MSSPTPILQLADQQRLLHALKTANARLDAVEQEKTEPIAIVGIGCRLPGGVDSPKSFWEFLLRAEDVRQEVPRDRWDIDHYYDPDPDKPNKLYVRQGYFLEQPVDQFDPSFFAISGVEAAKMDPSQRLMLEVVWEALENAAIPPESLRNSSTGVFMGQCFNDYQFITSNHEQLPDFYQGTGCGLSFTAGRIAYTLGLQGPTFCLDTACSSSLVALHLACQSLHTQESNLALVGGVNLMLHPSVTHLFCRGKALSPQGRCASFDASADGYARGEGCGVVVLKRLSDAVADGDRIWSVIRGSAMNHDGPSSGLTVPNTQAQQKVLQQALQNARLNPASVDYIECHGTGTPLGDPLEIAALAKVYCQERSPAQSLILGSVKTNIGHLEGAAGIASLIKAVLCLYHQQIPANLHFQEPNPRIDWEHLPLQIPTHPQAWLDGEQPRRAGVSSFGMSGTNTHVILEALPIPALTELPVPHKRPIQLLTLSAQTETALIDLAQRYEAFLTQQPAVSLADVCFTANTGRSSLSHRLAIVAATPQELQDKLRQVQARAPMAGVYQGKVISGAVPQIAFLFTGQGSQYPGMAQELYQTQPVFQTALNHCADILREFDVPLLEVLYGKRKEEREKREEQTQNLKFKIQNSSPSPHLPISPSSLTLNDTAYTQPALFALEYALYKLWRSWGIKPSVVMGHSVGEYVAACVAGVFSLEDGLKLIAARGRLMQQLPSGGGMASLMASVEQVKTAIADQPDVTIAAINGPQSTVISGPITVLQTIIEQFAIAGVKGKFLSVSHAFHSPLMQPMLPEFEQVAQQISYSTPRLKFIANVTGQVATSEVATPQYWCQHVLLPVNFAAGMQTLHQQSYDVFLECGPQPILLGMGRQCLTKDNGTWLPSLRSGQGDWQQMLTSLGELHVQGVEIAWQSFEQNYPPRRKVSLPTYPFQRQSYWSETPAENHRLWLPSDQIAHPLLGIKQRLADSLEQRFEQRLSSDTPAWLHDHQVFEWVIFPGAGYVELALAASGGAVRDLSINAPIALDQTANQATIVQTLIQADGMIKIFAQTEGETDWHLHATAWCDDTSELMPLPIDLSEWRSRCSQSVNPAELYTHLAEIGLNYGQAFQILRELQVGEGEFLAQVELTTELADADTYRLPPMLLDGAFQALTALQANHDADIYLPIGVERVRVYQPLGATAWVSGRGQLDGEDCAADLIFCNEHGAVLAEVEGLRCRRATRQVIRKMSQPGSNLDDLLYVLRWRQMSQDSLALSTPGRWLILGEESAAAELNQYLKAQNQSSQWARSQAIAELLKVVDQSTEPLIGIVLLCSVNTTTDAAMAAVEPVLQVVQTLLAQNVRLPQGLTLVTQRAIAIDASEDTHPAQAALWGLGRTLQIEQPQLGPRLIDVAQPDWERLSQTLLSETESQLALRGTQAFTPRLLRQQASGQLPLPATDGGVKLTILQRGSLDNLQLVANDCAPPVAGEVQVAVQAAGLNFRDVLNTLGAYPGEAGPLGGELAGVVTAIGAEVSELAVGDRVFGMGADCFATTCNTPATLLVKIPESLNFTAAATVPIAFCTAQAVLEHLSLKRGEKVLIHAATGGVGLAAVQLAQLIGAEIYATASAPKQAYLRELGIQHIYDSRSTDFGEQILRDTNGLGVDAVLNSLTSEGFIAASLSVLTQRGRFVEIGKRDIWTVEQMTHMRPDVEYQILAIDDWLAQAPQRVRNLLESITARFAIGELKPLKRRMYPLAEAPTAMRFMQQARHIGKLVLTVEHLQIRPNASYLITGGLGALGLEACTRLVEQGAKHVVLTSRREPNESIQQRLTELTSEYDCAIAIQTADVTEMAAVNGLLQTFGQDWPPLRGVIHAAGVLDDGAIAEQTMERFARVMAPKVKGAFNLHQATQHSELDFFVLYSSVTAALGSAGQSNYATANAFLDGLAQHRRAHGLCAASINWGPWAGVGMTANVKVQANLMRQGLSPLQPNDAHQAMTRLLTTGLANGVVLDADWSRLSQWLGEAQPPLLSNLLSKPVLPRQSPLLQQLQTVASQERQPILLGHLQQELQQILGLAQLSDPDIGFFDLGMDSLMALELQNRLQQQLGDTYTLPNTLAFDYPTIAKLAEHLTEKLGVLPQTKSQQIGQPQQISQISRSLETDAVAIVGLACRFPGAVDKDAYWQVLTHQIDAITEVPRDRWDIDAYYDPDPDARGKMITRYGGFIEDIDQFDAAFFGIAPREAVELDPQQRLLLEMSWQALEDANIAPATLVGSRTGVYVGICTNDYSQLIARGGEQAIGQYMGTGTAHSAAVGRVSYVLGLEGPSLAIDTACSSSLVALHQARQGLLNGDCELALVGGVNALLTPETTIYFSRGRFMAPDGRCKTFDAAADGYVRGEGCGMVVLKRLSEAERDGDRIYGILRGSAVNQDGASSGLTVPNGPSQQRVITDALAQAQIAPTDVTYVEAHGTGTSLGDPIEIQALHNVFGETRQTAHPLLVGSVKTNIGHLEAAAGIASVIKVALSLQHGAIPSQLHFQTPSPRIPWDAINIEVVAEPQSWPAGRQIAGVSGFAFQGTNAHVILEGYQLQPKALSTESPSEPGRYLLPLSGKQGTAVRKLASRYRNWLANDEVELADVCASAGSGRNHFAHRAGIVAATREQLCDDLQQLATGQLTIGHYPQQPKVACLFTGQGSQYVDMGRELYETQPTFKRVLDQCADILHEVNVPLLEVMYGNSKFKILCEKSKALQNSKAKSQNSSSEFQIHQTQFVQPALFALEYALYQLWRSWGIQPTMVMGHSVGEYVAACVAGVFSLEDGLKLIAARGRLMQQLPAGGTMVSLMAAVEQVRAGIVDQAEVVIAAINGPQSTVISGPAAAIKAAVAQFEAAGIKSKALPVSHAFHSPLMIPMLAEFEQVARQVSYAKPQLKLVANVTGQVIGEEVATPEYWCEHILAPVNFAAGMATLEQQGYDVFLECGPKPILLGMGRQCLAKDEAAWLPSLRPGQSDWQPLLNSLSELYVRGTKVDWQGFNQDYPQRRKVTLPTYPFQRQRYWVEVPSQPATHQPSGMTLQAPQTLLGERLSLPLMDQIRFQTSFSATYPNYLVDHQYYDRIVAAGTSHLVMALLAAQQASGLEAWSLQRIQFLEVLGLTEETARTVQVVLEPQGEQGYDYQLISCPAGQELEAVNDDQWKVYAKAVLEPLPLDASGIAVGAPPAIDLGATQQRCPQMLSHSEYYKAILQPLQGRFKLGESFQWTEQVWLGEGEALLKLQPASPQVKFLTSKVPHPGLLDSGMVMIPFLKAAQRRNDDNNAPVSYAFVGAASCQFFQSLDRSEQSWFYVKLNPSAVVSPTTPLSGDAYLLNGQGEVLVAFTGVQFRELKPQVLLRAFGLDLNDWYYQLAWQPSILTPEAQNGETQTVEVQPAGTQRKTPHSETLQSDSWLLFVSTQTSSLGDDLASTLIAQGYQTIQISPGDTFQQLDVGHYQLNPTAPGQFQQLLQEFAHYPPKGIVHLWSLDTHLQDLTQAQELSCGSTLYLLQAIHSVFPTGSPPLWLVTQGAQRLGQESLLQPQQASLWGLGRVIAWEYPHIRCVCLDLDPDAEAALTLQAVVQELQVTDEENQIAYRQGERHVARLTKLPANSDAAAVHIRADGGYCITGGLGALGLQVAQWLVNRGARQLVLLGRRQPAEIAQQAIAQMEAAGATVTVVSADIANWEEAKNLLTQLEAAPIPLRGVIHAAGVLDDGFLQQQSWERFVAVMQPKVQGAWNLHCLTQHLVLDFFVCFSSATALLGNPGQGNYAAANAFMDALMQERHRQGLPGLSLNWGPWEDSGMAAQLTNQNRLQGQGIKTIEPDLGLQTLAQSLPWPYAQVGIFSVDWSLFLRQFEGRPSPVILQNLAAELELATTSPQAPRLADLIAQLQSLERSQRQQQLVTYLTGVITKVLGRNPDDRPDATEGFFNLGMDSLMAIDLVTIIQRDLGITLSAIAAFEYANIEELAEHLEESLPKQNKANQPTSDADLQLEISQMSEEKLNASLLRELDQLEASLSFLD